MTGGSNQPTIRINVSARVRADPDRWVWRPMERFNPAAREYIYNSDELVSALRVYGRAVVPLLSSKHLPRFLLTAHGISGSGILGAWSWRVSPVTGRFVPESESPWVVWDLVLGDGRTLPVRSLSHPVWDASGRVPLKGQSERVSRKRQSGQRAG